MASLSSYLLSTLSKVGGIGGSGIPDFHYTIGDKVEAFAGKSIWDVHHSTRTNDAKQEATVFVLAKARGSSFTAVAQNTLKRMRTLRHPGILRYLEGAETPEAVYIATEPVTPLSQALDADSSDELKRWGLYKIAETMQFINEDCKLVHANLAAASVFVTKAGEWKLGGLELVDSPTASGGSGQQQAYRYYTSVIPGYSARMSPELEGQKWEAIEKSKPGAVDGWYLACLISEAYNGGLRSASQLQAQGQIPAPLWALCQRLLGQDLRRRMTPSDFLQTASRQGGFLDSEFIKTSIFLENIAVREEDEKAAFFSGLDALILGFPQAFSKYKILPELLKLMEFGGGDAKVLSGIIQIGKGLDEQEYNDLVTPAIVQLFSSNDRALRFSLLEHMDSFIQAIPSAVVSKRVFPNFVAGFLDAAPAIREATVKASLAIAPKLGQKSLNSDLVKQLVRLVADPEPGIRTNALICIGKLCTAKEGVLDLDGDGVSESSHRYVICPALLQALRDPFPPVRSASLAVSTACSPKWEAPEIARRVIPCLSPLLIDGEKPVRTAAFKCLGSMIGRVEAHSKTLPDTMAKKAAVTPAAATTVNAGQASGSAQAEAAASMAASETWGGWAVSSLSNTFSGALSLASSSLPIGQQQALSPSIVAVEGSGHEKSSVQVSAIFPKPEAADPASGSGGGGTGWEFDDDAWGDDAAVGDGWDVGNDDEEGWDSRHSPTKPSAPTTTTSSAYTTLSVGAKSGGMTMSNTQPPLLSSAASGGPSMPTAPKTSLKLARSTASSQKLTPGESTTSSTTAPRRKGLGAMKLGGTSKNAPPPNLDDFF